MSVEIVQTFRFESAHSLPRVPDTHKCKRLHGHSYQVDVHVLGPVDPDTGWVIDFFDIEAFFSPISKALDHRVLNDVPGLDNPTAENMAVWIWRKLKPVLPALSQVVVHETGTSRAIYRG